MGGDEGDLVRVAEGQVGVDEDEDIGYGSRQWEDAVEGGPGTWVGVEDDGEEGGRLLGGGDLVVVGDVYGVHVASRGLLPAGDVLVEIRPPRMEDARGGAWQSRSSS